MPMTKQKEEVERRNIAMYSSEWQLVDEINKRYGFRNVSGALRFIINDYMRLTGRGQ